MVSFLIASFAALASIISAHPEHGYSASKLKRDILLRDHTAHIGARSLSGCNNAAAAQALQTRSIQRRVDQVKALRKRNDIQSAPRKNKRDLAALQAWEAINHNETGVYEFDMFTALEDVFSANTSCILAPEITDGPYYVVGEYLRSNVKESMYSEGVDVFLEVQYIDVNTCQPVPNVAVDIWNANATGVYSGISTNGNYAADGVNSTYLRGIQLTDHEGVASFETIFPGHYDGRAVHTHLLSHTNATVMPNGTISVWNAPVSHIGQLFWDEDLRAEVEATYPYTLNTQALTTNDEDMWSVLQADEFYDPLPQYVYLGEAIEDGLFAWIQIGINVTADYSSDDYYGVAGYIDEDGGHASSNGMGGASGGNGTMNGTMPSGSFSDTPPASTSA